MKFTTKTLRYEGLSMWPCFQEGDILELAPVDFERIRRGDCIAYRSTGGQLAAHRVVGTGNGLVTRGDALAARDDEPVQADQVIGRVVRRHRLGQKSPIAGGWPGRIAGRFYRYAGRIDPNRRSRGGRLARAIRAVSGRLLMLCCRQGVVRAMKLNGGEKVRVFELGGRIVARQESLQAEWRVAWPWSLLVEVPKDRR